MTEKKVIGKPFEKGNKFGKGRQKLTEEQKELRRLLKSEPGKLLIAKYWYTDYSDLKKAIKRQNISTGELFVARLFERGISKADHNIFETIYKKLGWDRDEVDLGNNIQSISLNYKV